MIDLDDLIAESERHYIEMNGLNSRAAEVMMELSAALVSVRAERDAALAAVERVREVLAKWEAQQDHNREILGSGGLGHFQAIDCTGDLRAALDGAPEPEEKP